MHDATSADRPEPDRLLVEIADYVMDFEPVSRVARETARWCLFDSLGCATLALKYPECVKLLGPVVPGAVLSGGARVPGTAFELDPVQAAFNIGCMIRWLDYNDTWLAAEWGHPSDNLGAILACADYCCRAGKRDGNTPTVADLLDAMIKAHEIQGVLALTHAFNRVGLDHVLLVRIASTAVATAMLGGSRSQIVDALSSAWLDGGALRTYRHAPNTGSRKSWAAGDATSRAVRLALWTLAGETGYPSALTAKRWGFQDVLFGGRPIELPQPLGTYVMENVLFKIAFPAEFHGQTAVEAAVQLHRQVCDRLDGIDHVCIETTESSQRIIDKTGTLANPADRDHCLQYMTAVALIHGTLTADHYEAATAADPRIDRLRGQMQVEVNPQFSRDYLDPEKRSIANAVQVVFADGSRTDRVVVEYPLGHRRRRADGAPLLREKLATNLATRFHSDRCRQILELCDRPDTLDILPVHKLLDLFVVHD